MRRATHSQQAEDAMNTKIEGGTAAKRHITRHFTRVQKAWYSQACLIGDDDRAKIYGQEEFGLSVYEALDEGEPEAVKGEIYVRWKTVVRDRVDARLEAFQDGWNLLPYVADVLATLTEEPNMDGDRFQELLLKAGFTDATPLEPEQGSTRNIFRARKEAYDAEHGNAKPKIKP